MATLLLLIGYVLIKRRLVVAHKRVMLTAFGVSVLFLVCYLTYHYFHGDTKFPKYPPAAIRYFYFAVLISHIILAMFVPFLAIATIYLGLREKNALHRKLAKWTFPVWLYVSVTGVIVYLMLYQLYPPVPIGHILP